MFAGQLIRAGIQRICCILEPSILNTMLPVRFFTSRNRGTDGTLLILGTILMNTDPFGFSPASDE
jgi:hypothetical protein